MSKAKKLDLSIQDLIDIAKAINENTLANRIKNKEDRIGTDIFIRQTFNISRKDFSETIKNTNIKYNPSCFLYDIPKDYESNTKVTPSRDIGEVVQSNTKVLPTKEADKVIQSNAKVMLKENTEIAIRKEVLEAVKNAIDIEYPELKEMIEQYKMNKEHKDIIEIPEIRLDNPKLSGDVVSKSFKSYEKVFDEFVEFCKNRKETQKDLMALALIEFMNRYK